MGIFKTNTAKQLAKEATAEWRKIHKTKYTTYARPQKREKVGNKIMVDGKLVYPKQLAIIRNKKFTEDYLSTHPCVDCPESDPIVLEFDHVRGIKDMAVSVGIFAGWSLKRLEAEIAKCEVRCANCHRKATHKRNMLCKADK